MSTASNDFTEVSEEPKKTTRRKRRSSKKDADAVPLVDIEPVVRESLSNTDAVALHDALALNIPKDAESRIAIFTHATPDPDAIGSMLGVKFLLYKKYKIECDLFFSGEISHPQNKTMVQLLNCNLLPVDKYDPKNYSVNILVDTIPANAGIGDIENITFDIVIDHHKETPDKSFAGCCIHHFSGSACGIVMDIIKGYNLEFQSSIDDDVVVATAMLVGIIIDTSFCLSMDTAKRDVDAYNYLMQHRDSDATRKIIHFNWPMPWVKLLGKAITEMTLDEGIAVVGLGQLSADQENVIAVIADSMLYWGSINTAVAFALFDGGYIKGSVRTNDDTREVHIICKQIAGEHGSGGGKDGAGSFTQPMGSFTFGADDDAELKEEFWQDIKKLNNNRIFKILKV